MNLRSLLISVAGAALLLFHTGGMASMARTTAAVGVEVAAAEQAPGPLSVEEMEIFVARVTLYGVADMKSAGSSRSTGRPSQYRWI